MQGPYSLFHKIIAPVLPPITVHREALVNKLCEVIVGTLPAGKLMKTAQYKLMLLYAPAGYGKTTLLADFAQHTSMPCCWYFLDHADIDKMAFFKAVLESIRQRFPTFGSSLDQLLAAAILVDSNTERQEALLKFIDVFATSIQNEIHERFALFLCNYHEINANLSLNVLITSLISKLPPQCIIVIESRTIPDIEFAPFVAQRQMFGLNSKLLRFNPQEIQHLAHIQGLAPLSDAEAQRLTNSYDGWIAGILLGTRLGDAPFLHENTPDTPTFSATSRSFVFAYLVDEVFSREPEVYAFLKEAAILEQMTPAFCECILAVTHAAQILHYLEKQALFVTHSGEGDQIMYTCHPLLRNLLTEDLRLHFPERFVALHRSAAEMFHAAHDYQHAVYHALEAQSYDLATSLIIEAHHSLLAQGCADTLANWIDALPWLITMHNPHILLIRAELYLLIGMHIKARPLLEQALNLQMSPGGNPDEYTTLQAAVAIASSKAFFQAGEHQHARLLCQEILARLPADEKDLRAEIHTLLGVCTNLLGDFRTGIIHLQKALQLVGRNTVSRQTADLHSNIASAYSLLGNFALAEHHLACASTCWEHLHDEWGKVNNLIRAGLIKHRQGFFAEAEHLFNTTLTMARASSFQRGEAYALVNLGEFYQDQELYERSLAVTEQGLALARHLGDRYLVNSALCILAMTYLLIDDAPTALLLVSEIEVEIASKETFTSGYESVIRELTHGTILLYLQRYEEASTSLQTVEAHLAICGLKREQLLALLRLSACQLKLGQNEEATLSLEKVGKVTQYDEYEYIMHSELKRLPLIAAYIQSLPEFSRLRQWLHIEQVSENGIMLPDSAPVPDNSTIDRITEQQRLRIMAFGEPTVILDQEPITRWRLARVLELFFFFLNYGRAAHKEQIINALWSEEDEQIEKKLRTTVYYLRKTLGENCVVFRNGSYSLDLTSTYNNDVWYDVAVFQDLTRRSRQALSDEDTPTAKTLLTDMCQLYKGDYVQSFYSDWCTRQRDELRRGYLDARQHLARIAAVEEQFDESIVHWQHMLAIDDCQENAHYGLMRCYLRQGKRGLALRQYQRCLDILTEFGATPGPNIQHLYQRFLAKNT